MPNNNPTGRNQYSEGKGRSGSAKQAKGAERPPSRPKPETGQPPRDRSGGGSQRAARGDSGH